MEFDLVHLVSEMSWPVRITNLFMIILAIYAIYVAIERWLVYSKASAQNVSFVISLRDALSKRNMEGALKSAGEHVNSPVAKVMEGALKAVKTGHGAVTAGTLDAEELDVVDNVTRTLDRVKERETTDLRRGLSGLATVASITPFVGLFGTVLGIINAFGLLKKSGGSIEVVGPAIAEALISTAVGLAVAIFAAMFFNFFTTKVENMTVDMNDVSSEFLDYVVIEGRQ